MIKEKARKYTKTSFAVHRFPVEGSIKRLLKQEGKFLHGTRGKPTRGPRGNKR
ncbi:MAG: hypothetical protein GXP33_03860 [Spirochaetes bacterium]|nr:hypothetical protein [Spirochaetota bacterium]